MKLEHRDNCILFVYNPNPSKVFGFFDEDDGKIYVSSRLGLLARECVYLHEKSHKECFDGGCKCWSKGTDYWCEYHAMRGELQKVRAIGCVRLKRAYLKHAKDALVKYNAQPEVYGAHLAALRKLMRTKAFRDFVKEDEE